MPTNTQGIRREVEPLGDGLFAYVQGDGSWGWSNSGLIVSEGETLLIDTLFTGSLTRDMLAPTAAPPPRRRPSTPSSTPTPTATTPSATIWWRAPASSPPTPR